MYANGTGTERDINLAVDWLNKAAEQGNIDAQYLLGTWYLDGNLIPKIDSIGIKWIMKAAKEGSIPANNRLAQEYWDGKSIDRNFDTAIALYNSTAQKGNIFGQMSLARACERGFCGKSSFQEAYYWYYIASLTMPELSDDRDRVAQYLTRDQLENLQKKANIWLIEK